MNQPFPVRAVAGCLALAAFSIAIISGLAAGRSTDSIISSALVAMLLSQVVGYVAGLIISRTLVESMNSHTAPRTAPAPVEVSTQPGKSSGAPGASDS